MFTAAIFAIGTPASADKVAVAPAISSETAGSYDYFFSVRPEFLALFGEITSAGFAAEFGMAGSNRLFFTAEFNGGVHYAGGGLNFGYTSIVHDIRYRYLQIKSGSPFDELRFTAGVHAGLHHIVIPVNLESTSGDRLGRIYGQYTGMAGIFWKFTWGYIDVTNRLLFGYRRDSPWYEEAVNDIIRKKNANLAYTIGIGYTITRERGQ
jgi:hypothetical protein